MKNYILISALFIGLISQAQPGKVLSFQRLSYNVGNLTIPKDSVKNIGQSSCFLGDLDGDGRKEILTTSWGTLGLAHILSLNSNGTVFKRVTIGRNRGLPSNATPSWYSFGASCANIGDIDKDGVTDIAIGNSGESGYSGDVFVIFLNSNGTIKSYKVIREQTNGFNVTLGSKDNFGASVISLGDIDKNGTKELVIGAPYTNDGSVQSGAIWILSIDSAVNCKDFKKISHTSGGGSVLGINVSGTRFGYTSANYTDIDGDNISEFLIGAPFSKKYGTSSSGSFYCISINANKTLKSAKLISDTSLSFGDTLIQPSRLSESIANVGDIDGNGFDDIVVSTSFQGFFTSYFGRGVARVLLMDDKFKIKSNVVWDSLQNGIPAYNHDAYFGLGLVGLGDINKDGKLDVLVGLPEDFTNASGYGACYVLFLDGKVYNSKTHSTAYSNKINIFPNPSISGNPITIKLSEELINKEFTLSIHSVLGQEIRTSTVKTSENVLTINDLDLTSGMYIITINQREQSYHFTLNVE